MLDERGPWLLELNTMPGFTRRLSSAQMADVWTDLRKLGLGTSDGSDSINNFRRALRPKTGHAYLVAVTADGDFWNYTRVVPVGEELDPALTALLRELAVLAWAAKTAWPRARRKLFPRKPSRRASRAKTAAAIETTAEAAA